MEKLDGKSMDIVEQNIEQLKELFPEVFAEGKIKFDQLQELLGNYVVEDEDHYNFTWHGKRKAGRLAQTPSTGTLRPCKEESVDWDTTQNLFIEGDNLEVLKLLQKSYHRQVKMIYIDPPYNTGKEFIYPDRFQDNLDTYLKYTGQLDDDGYKFSTNTDSTGRYHTNWLNMMYPRLKLARNLLRDDGVIFISIDDNEQANLKKICDDVFGELNFLTDIIWQKKYAPQNDAKYFSDSHEHILCYAKNIDSFSIGLLPRTKEANSRYKNPDNDPRGPWKSSDLTRQEYRPRDDYEITNPKTGKKFSPPKGCSWGRPQETVEEMIGDNRIWFGSDGNSVPSIKRFLSEVKQGITPQTIWERKDVGDTQEGKKLIKEYLGNVSIFETAKPPRLIQRQLLVSNVADEDIVLDFFAGSGSAAEAVMRSETKARYILVQLPEKCDEKTEAYKASYETVADICKERIRRAAKKIQEENPDCKGDFGFKVLKLDSSNIRRWEADFDTLEQDLLNAVDYIKQDRSSEDVLYELLLKYGLDLTVPIETRTIAGKTVYSIGMGALVACLEKDVSMDVVNGIGGLKEELQPEIMRVVFKDEGFKDDVVKTNALQTLKRYGIEDIKSL